MINRKTLSEIAVPINPLDLFSEWYKEHLSSGAEIPDNVCLATASADGRVSARIVLLKDFGEAGFIFYTNYESKKASQLINNPNAAMLFYWPESGRQVRIEGLAEKTSREISEAYFGTRPRESQLAAWASDQSSEIPDRAHLERKFNYYKQIFEGLPVHKPDRWGGFILTPYWYEFWENGDHRLHDRIAYKRKDDQWLIDRLAP
jgi:pyridoxamine 5'-phosphate oxidase